VNPGPRLMPQFRNRPSSAANLNPPAKLGRPGPSLQSFVTPSQPPARRLIVNPWWRRTTLPSQVTPRAHRNLTNAPPRPLLPRRLPPRTRPPSRTATRLRIGTRGRGKRSPHISSSFSSSAPFPKKSRTRTRTRTRRILRMQGEGVPGIVQTMALKYIPLDDALYR